MNKKSFFDYIVDNLKNESICYENSNISLLEDNNNSLYKYFDNFLETSKKINLTGLKTSTEILDKLFIDSIIIYFLSFKYLNDKNILNNNNLDNTTINFPLSYIDIGTGGGFPGFIFNILNNNLDTHLLDSVNKKINFLNNTIMNIYNASITTKDITNNIVVNDFYENASTKTSKLKKINTHTIWSRIEDFAHDKEYRETFDIASGRSLAYLPTFYEYMLPLLKINGIGIIPKELSDEELNAGNNALKILGGKVLENISYSLNNRKRNILIIKKVKKTPNLYPRLGNLPKKQPL